MTIFRRPATVQFFEVIPFEVPATLAEPPPTWTGAFPAAEVLDTIEALDLASGEYHIPKGLWGQLFCKVWADGPQRLLGSYTKDIASAVEVEYKGTVEEIILREGEGVVQPAYVAFFPDSVVGILRCATSSPGAASVAHWMSEFGGYSCAFQALPNIDVLAQLDGPAEEKLSVFFSGPKRLLKRITDARPDVGMAMQAAAAVSKSTQAGVWLSTEHRSERPEWWVGMEAAISDLDNAGLLPELTAARVHMSHERTANLRNTYISSRVQVETGGRKRIDRSGAAQGLFDAYADRRAAIFAALEYRRGIAGGTT